MARSPIEIKTGPLLFGDFTATPCGPVWNIEIKYPLWYRMYCAGLLACMKAYSPPRNTNGSNQS